MFDLVVYKMYKCLNSVRQVVIVIVVSQVEFQSSEYLKRRRHAGRSVESAVDRLERLQWRNERYRQLRSVESADDRLEHLQRRIQRETVESPHDRLRTSATEKTRPALSDCEYIVECPKGRLESLQRRRQRIGEVTGHE